MSHYKIKKIFLYLGDFHIVIHAKNVLLKARLYFENPKTLFQTKTTLNLLRSVLGATHVEQSQISLLIYSMTPLLERLKGKQHAHGKFLNLTISLSSCKIDNLPSTTLFFQVRGLGNFDPYLQLSLTIEPRKNQLKIFHRSTKPVALFPQRCRALGLLTGCVKRSG